MEPYLLGYRQLRCGDLSLLYSKGEIRQIRMGDIQVINAAYAAVRDQNWGTVPFQITEESILEDQDGFQIVIRLSYLEYDIDFDAMIQIQGKSNQLSFCFTGHSNSLFQRNRIGICVLHPIKECKGHPIRIVHPDESISTGTFPDQISPNQPFMNIAGMIWKPADLMEAELHFSGDIFEMEDQRNWSDASYKTYCTPLERPFPVKVKAGEQVSQSVLLKVSYFKESLTRVKASHISLATSGASSYPLPSIGLGSQSSKEAFSEQETGILKDISFQHLRSDLHLGNAELEQNYDHMAEEQEKLGWPLELVLHFHMRYREELKDFMDLFRRRPLPLARIILFDKEQLTKSVLLKQVLPEMRSTFPDTPIGGGTNAYFAELNRNHPDAKALDFISYSICPQVHAFDRLTLIENIEAQSDTVITAKKLFNKPVSIGAITLNQRFNIVATKEGAEDKNYPLTDERQSTVFAAGWTLGSIKQLCMAGSSSLSYFETLGSRGLLERKANGVLLYPLFHLFKEVLDEKTTHMLNLRSSNPHCVDGLMLQGAEYERMLLVNHYETEQTLKIDFQGKKAEQMYILTEKGWSETPVKNLQHFTMNSSSMYKIIFES